MKRLIVMFTCICSLAVSIGQVNAQDAAEVEKPITIDFVRKDIHKVMHYIGLKSGWTIKVDDDVKLDITVIFRNSDWLDVLMSICESNKLTFDVDEEGKSITIHRDEGKYSKFREMKFGADGTATVCFSKVSVWDAIAAVCIARNVQCLVGRYVEGKRYKPGRFSYNAKRASLYAEGITLDELLRELARQGDFKYEWRKYNRQKDGVDGEGVYLEPIPLK